jgi:hypothetical protein
VAEEELVFRKFLPIHVLTWKTSPSDATRTSRTSPGGGVPDYPFCCQPAAPNVSSVRQGDRALGKDRRRPPAAAVLTKNILITHHLEPVLAVKSRFLSKHEV